MPTTIVKHNLPRTQEKAIRKVAISNAATTAHKEVTSNATIKVVINSVAAINNAEAINSVVAISNAVAISSAAITTVLNRVATTHVTNRARASSRKATSSVPTTVLSKAAINSAVAISNVAATSSAVAISSVAGTSSVAAISNVAMAISVPAVARCRAHVHRCDSLHVHNALNMRNQ